VYHGVRPLEEGARSGTYVSDFKRQWEFWLHTTKNTALGGQLGGQFVTRSDLLVFAQKVPAPPPADVNAAPQPAIRFASPHSIPENDS
jgi:hypothetical protein